MSFNNKVVIVTGASSGIGAAITLKFAAEGAYLSIVGRNEKKLQAVSEKCAEIGKKPLVLIADVSKDDDAARIVDETIKKYNRLDVLINNAGISHPMKFTDEKIMQVFDTTMRINLRSVVHLTHLASKHLFETKGNIINMSSVASLKVMHQEAVCYCTSKAALDHFTRTIASELASKGVRVNTINPGPVKTDIINNFNIPEEHKALVWERMRKSTAFQRISEPEEIADLALFLASEKAAAITGASFVTDNGYMVKPVYG